MNRKICAGIVAQVDAGKTTLCESMLFFSDCIRKRGRVDNCDTFFDYNLAEKQHGITLYSKEAKIQWNDSEISIIDTPGHHDFRAEVERVIPILDLFLFVVNVSELKKQQNVFLFQQLQKNGKPILVFASKMDMNRISVPEALRILSGSYSDKCVQYFKGSFCGDSAATIDDVFLEAYLEGMPVSRSHTMHCIRNMSVYPVIFGSGLNGDGVKEVLDLISELACVPENNLNEAQRCAYVYKIDRDDKGIRQTHVKILSGKYEARNDVSICCSQGERQREKINEIRQINGARYQQVSCASAGDIVAFTGLSIPRTGQYIDSQIILTGAYKPSKNPIEYSVSCDNKISSDSLLNALRLLEEEDPSFTVISSVSDENIYVHLKGDLQKDILRETMEKRFHIPVEFGSAHVDYYETITDCVYGNGHYEPLKHYAEVRVKLSPLARGSGIVYESECPEDVLSSNWQNIVLNSLRSFCLRGVLTGAPVTDIKITLLSGKYHVKHTEGGDFREAVIRAVRQGLMKANSILLEPYAAFVIVCPTGTSGKVLTDLEQEQLKVDQHSFAEDGLLKISGGGSLLSVDALRKKYMISYGDTVFFEYAESGLFPCHDSEKRIKETAYDPQADREQSPDSVFCFHGAGHIVSWDQVDNNMHTDPVQPKINKQASSYSISEKEFHEILKKYSLIAETPSIYKPKEESMTHEPSVFTTLPSLYLIDGSNLLHAYASWSAECIKQETKTDVLQDKLVSDLVNYIMFTGASAQIVFDGYNASSQNENRCVINDTLTILYSETESADVVLERLASDIGPDYKCKMVTSDQMVQISALHSGIVRISSREFLEEMAGGLAKLRERICVQNNALSIPLSIFSRN